MKVLSSPESPGQRSVRRVSKPLMEKRRRERINQSLETLRLLMLESSHNEKLKNPKVEKAEILESVVQFLKSEKEVDRVLPREQTCTRQHNYNDGVRTCLLRVSRFMATKGQGSEATGGDPVQASFAHPEPHTHPSSPGDIHKALTPAPAGLGPRNLSHHQQHGISRPYLTHTDLCETRKLLSPTAERTHISDPVWRPWPQ
ncbi:hairy-related 5 [Echeneis naucrates]|uniref:Transcription factor HES-7.1-B-like n=1 Tax=Echeneis naucrates TaxID=173247 RepID=A0A665WTG7_ECHNA|nr:transcription factor HES-7.1-B-like [Echeneis naucrates]